jgi:hypothetical protein
MNFQIDGGLYYPFSAAESCRPGSAERKRHQIGGLIARGAARPDQVKSIIEELRPYDRSGLRNYSGLRS